MADITDAFQITPVEDLLNQKAQAFTPDVGFPALVSVTTTPAAVLRYTIASVAWARRISVSGQCFFSYSQSGHYVELRWYNGATKFATAKPYLPTATIGTSGHADGYFDLAGGASSVLELRLARISGTGAVTNDGSDYTQAAVVAVPI